MKTPTYLHITAVFLSGIFFCCSSDIYNSSIQLEKDTQTLNAFIASHGLDKKNNSIVELGDRTSEELEAEEIVPLTDTVKKSGNYYYLITQKGVSPKPTSSSKVLMRFKGSNLETGEEFINTLEDQPPSKINLYYAIDAIKSGVTQFNTGELDTDLQYINEARGYLIAPSTMGWKNYTCPPSPVPPNTCLLFEVRVYTVVVDEEEEEEEEDIEENNSLQTL